MQWCRVVALLVVSATLCVNAGPLVYQIQMMPFEGAHNVKPRTTDDGHEFGGMFDHYVCTSLDGPDCAMTNGISKRTGFEQSTLELLADLVKKKIGTTAETKAPRAEAPENPLVAEDTEEYSTMVAEDGTEVMVFQVNSLRDGYISNSEMQRLTNVVTRAMFAHMQKQNAEEEQDETSQSATAHQDSDGVFFEPQWSDEPADDYGDEYTYEVTYTTSSSSSPLFDNGDSQEQGQDARGDFSMNLNMRMSRPGQRPTGEATPKEASPVDNNMVTAELSEKLGDESLHAFTIGIDGQARLVPPSEVHAALKRKLQRTDSENDDSDEQQSAQQHLLSSLLDAWMASAQRQQQIAAQTTSTPSQTTTAQSSRSFQQPPAENSPIPQPSAVPVSSPVPQSSVRHPPRPTEYTPPRSAPAHPAHPVHPPANPPSPPPRSVPTAAPSASPQPHNGHPEHTSQSQRGTASGTASGTAPGAPPRSTQYDRQPPAQAQYKFSSARTSETSQHSSSSSSASSISSSQQQPHQAHQSSKQTQSSVRVQQQSHHRREGERNAGSRDVGSRDAEDE